MTQTEPTYLDVQAEVGITKHIGGIEATDALLDLCRVGPEQRVLYVGCGIGAGPVHIARTRRCHVTGVDISERMIGWSRQRAREERLEHRLSFRAGDILGLPFEDGRFDATLVESVAAFVDDKARAIAECARVTRPGGWVGMNEAFWTAPVSAALQLSARQQLGAELLPAEAWRALWEDSGLVEQHIEIRAIDARAEVRGRLQWVGARWVIRGLGRLAALYAGNAAARRAIRAQWGGAVEELRAMGYGLFVGRKPEP